MLFVLSAIHSLSKYFFPIKIIVFSRINICSLNDFFHLISDAWWCFPFEAMESLSCHLMWVAAATYCTILAPKGLLATLIGVLGMAHFSLGRGSGSFCGGFLIGEVGTREAFRYMGLLAVVGGFMYYGLHLVYLKKFDIVDEKDEQEGAENGENEKLTEPKTRDQGTTMSQERLSLWVKYNQIGSLASLPRGSKVRQRKCFFCRVAYFEHLNITRAYFRNICADMPQ